MLHPETLDLLTRLKATSRAPVEVFTPVNESVVHFVAREGKDAMYKSIELRKACCHIRKMEPLSRALAGKDAWIHGLRPRRSRALAPRPLATPRWVMPPLDCVISKGPLRRGGGSYYGRRRDDLA